MIKRLGSVTAVVVVAVSLALTASPSSGLTPDGAPLSAVPRDQSSGIDVGGVIERVRHPVHVSGANPDVLEVNGRLYRAEFASWGFGIGVGQRERPSAPDRAVRAEASRGSVPGEVDHQEEVVLRLAVRRVTTGTSSLDLTLGAWRAESNRAEREIAPGLAETVTAREGSTEWAFILSDPPSPGGDLSIEAEISAAGPVELVGSGAQGEAARLPGPAWRFPLGAGRWVRMGEMVVIDASGREIHRALPVAWSGGVRLDVPARVLRGAAFPVTIDPVLSPEYPASDPVYGLAVNDQFSPAVAWNGTSYLLAWTDDRDGGADIYGTRVTPEGAVLDPTGIPVSVSPGDQVSPAIACDATNCLVAWEDRRSGAGRIYAARVTPSGVVLDRPGIAVALSGRDESSPALAWDGANYMLAWEDAGSGDGDVHGTRVSPEGVVLDPDGIDISAAAGMQSAPALAWNGTSYLVVWEDDRCGSDGCGDIYGARVSPAGLVLDPEGIIISAAAGVQSSPALTWSGTDYLAVWEDDRCGNSDCSDIYGAHVSAEGELLDPGGIAISTAEAAQGLPAIVWDGANFLVVWWDSRSGTSFDIYGSFVAPGGARVPSLRSAGIAISTAPDRQYAPALAWDGRNYLVAWEDDRCGGPLCSDIYAARVSPEEAVLDQSGVAVSGAADAQLSPVVASSGDGYLVVWEDDRSGERDIYGARLGPGGDLLDPSGIAISRVPGDQRFPAVGWDGTNFMVVWEDGRNDDRDIYGARVGPGGELLDPSGIAISTSENDQFRPGVAGGGAADLVVWLDANARYGPVIYGARVSKEGQVLDRSGIPIGAAVGNDGPAAVAWSGQDYLVVWVGPNRASNDDIYGVRVGVDGAVLDRPAITVSSAPNNQRFPAVAWGGTGYLVAWEDFRSGVSPDIYAARVSRDGDLLDPAGLPVCTEASLQLAPAAAWNGTSFWVFWSDYRSGATQDIYGSRVSASGEILPAGSSGIVIAASGTGESSPRAASGPTGRIAVVYDRFSGNPADGARRAFLRFFDECRQDGGGGSIECPFALVSPPDRTVLPRSSAPATFMWGAGDLTQFRVEFSTSPEFARPLVRSRKKFAAGSTYTPSVKKWDAVRRLASPGAPIYWRVVGKVKGSKQKISSRDTNTLTFLPYSL